MRESQYQIPTTLLDKEIVAEVTQTETIEQRQVAEIFADQNIQFEYTTEMHRILKETELHIDWCRHEALTTPPESKPSFGGRILQVIGMERKNG